VAFLLQKLEQSSKDEKMCIAALSIIRHLVNAAGMRVYEGHPINELLTGIILSIFRI